MRLTLFMYPVVGAALGVAASGCDSALADTAEVGRSEATLLSSGFAATPTTQAYPTRPKDWSAFRFKLVDFNGDGTPDLVEESPGGPPGSISPPAFGTGALDAHWKVWFNTAGTFAALPSELAVPNLSFGRMHGTHWDTFDIDGDGLIDLVETADRSVVGSGPDQKRVFGAASGAPYWNVYRGTGTGFAKTALTWPVPIVTDPDGLFTRERGNGPYGADWTTRDMDGDGRDDVVVTGRAGAALDTWLIYYNTGTGFSTTPTPWAFSPVSPPHPRIMWRWYHGAPDYLEDADGDGRPDWIHLSISARTFTVAKNTGTGFDAAVAWSVPSVPTCPAVHADGYAFADVDGDGLVDLVSPANSCADVVWNWAAPYWKVYRNTGSNFDAMPTLHAVPRSSSEGIARVDSLLNANTWTTMDFNGDGVPDLGMVVSVGAGNVELRLYAGQ